MAHNPDRRMLLAGLGAAGALALTRKAHAAQLAPSGPTIKDLSSQICKPRAQAETRIAIPSLPSSPTAQFVIDVPGVYYLTGPMTGLPNMNFLEIRCGQVEVHGDDWHVEGNGAVGTCIVTPTPQSNIIIYDWSCRNWQNTCINLQNSPNSLVETSQFQDCNGFGSMGIGVGILALGDNSFIWDCDQFNCLGSLMSVGHYSAIEEPLSVGGIGGCFACGEGSVIENAFAMQNNGVGVTLGPRSTLTLSRIIDNGGVVCGQECVVYDCEIAGTTGAGIAVTGRECDIEENTITRCAAGIDVASGSHGTLIDSNTIMGCPSGIYVDNGAQRCCVIRNEVSSGLLGSVAYSIGASSSHGTIRNVTGGGDIGPLGPHDNIEY